MSMEHNISQPGHRSCVNICIKLTKTIVRKIHVILYPSLIHFYICQKCCLFGHLVKFVLIFSEEIGCCVFYFDKTATSHHLLTHHPQGLVTPPLYYYLIDKIIFHITVKWLEVSVLWTLWLNYCWVRDTRNTTEYRLLQSSASGLNTRYVSPAIG